MVWYEILVGVITNERPRSSSCTVSGVRGWSDRLIVKGEQKIDSLSLLLSSLTYSRCIPQG